MTLLEFQFDLAKTRHMLLRRIGSGKFRVESRFPFNGSVVGMPCALLGRHRCLLITSLVILLGHRMDLPTRIAMSLCFGVTLEPTERVVIPAVRVDID